MVNLCILLFGYPNRNRLRVVYHCHTSYSGEVMKSAHVSVFRITRRLSHFCCSWGHPFLAGNAALPSPRSYKHMGQPDEVISQVAPPWRPKATSVLLGSSLGRPKAGSCIRCRDQCCIPRRERYKGGKRPAVQWPRSLLKVLHALGGGPTGFLVGNNEKKGPYNGCAGTRWQWFPLV